MTQYADYQNGYYGSRKNMNGDGSSVYDDRKWEYTFNADKTPATVVEKVLSEENYNIVNKTEYTYESGVLTSRRRISMIPRRESTRQTELLRNILTKTVIW